MANISLVPLMVDNPRILDGYLPQIPATMHCYNNYIYIESESQ